MPYGYKKHHKYKKIDMEKMKKDSDKSIEGIASIKKYKGKGRYK